MPDEKSAYGTTAAETARAPQVTASCDELESALGRHDETLAELEKRLSTGGVLRNEPQAEPGAKERDPRTAVPLAERIQAATARIIRYTDACRSIIRRLEI